jgi:hypothetical protein
MILKIAREFQRGACRKMKRSGLRFAPRFGIGWLGARLATRHLAWHGAIDLFKMRKKFAEHGEMLRAGHCLALGFSCRIAADGAKNSVQRIHNFYLSI